MSNNQNDLNDVMDVLRENAGVLTESDRDIPEEDEAVIRSSAWSDIPLLKTENENIKYWMHNNQVQINTDHSISNSEKFPKKLYIMPRRPQMRAESRRHSLRGPEPIDEHSTEYHYIYSNISIGMGALTMQQQSVRVDEEDSTRSTSPESDSSEYNPGPSSVETIQTSESPSPFDSESRRLSKSQKEKMSEDEIEKRRKEANKRNSKNYNKNKKDKEKELRNELEQAKGLNYRMKQNDISMKNMILECYDFTRTIIQISDVVVDPFINRTEFEERLRIIDSEASRNKLSDSNIRKLAEDFREKKTIHDKAKNDTKLKRENTNTYGSRKSRALHSMNIAELELKRAELTFDYQRLSRRAMYINSVKEQMASLFNFRSIGTGFVYLPNETKASIERLCQILKNESPTNSQRRSI